MPEVEERWRVLAARKWSELESVEIDGRIVYFDVIRRRAKGGALVEVPIGLRVLRKDEARKSFFEAVRWAQTEGLLPKDLAGVSNVRDKTLDPKTFDDMETLCILARAIREPKEPHDQYRTVHQLEADHDMRSLEELWAKYRLYEDLTDPRESIQTEAEMWAVIAAVRSSESLRPLNGCVSRDQNACILFMASQSLDSPAFKSFCTRAVNSTQAS